MIVREVVVVALLAMTRVAEASWYYEGSCAGECAPDRVAIHWHGTFATQAECEAGRASDPKREVVLAAGNTGNIGFCYESDTPPGDGGPAPEPASSLPTQSWSIGLLAGPGWTLHDPSLAADPVAPDTAGLDVDVIAGGRPGVGFALSAGVEATTITAASVPSGRQRMWLAPVAVGFVVAPRLGSHVRLDLRADLGLALGVVCGDCGSGVAAYYGDLRVGVDLYGAGANGLSLAAIAIFESHGDDAPVIWAPPVMVRIAWIHRNVELRW